MTIAPADMAPAKSAGKKNGYRRSRACRVSKTMAPAGCQTVSAALFKS
jgi:hypothetical protein